MSVELMKYLIMKIKNSHTVQHRVSKTLGMIMVFSILFSCSRPPGFTRYVFKPDNNPQNIEKQIFDIEEHHSGSCKLHMKDASVYILDIWYFNELDTLFEGNGTLYDANRKPLRIDNFKIPLKNVSLIETNEQNINPSIVTIAIVTGASIAMAVYCIYNPKACFGSCPTFYVSDGEEMLLQAEGFSGAVAPSLEESNIDITSEVR